MTSSTRIVGRQYPRPRKTTQESNNSSEPSWHFRIRCSSYLGLTKGMKWRRRPAGDSFLSILSSFPVRERIKGGFFRAAFTRSVDITVDHSCLHATITINMKRLCLARYPPPPPPPVSLQSTTMRLNRIKRQKKQTQSGSRLLLCWKQLRSSESAVMKYRARHRKKDAL